jgi:hypothetical protein
MFRLTSTAFLLVLGSAAQQLTVSPGTIAGLELVGPESPEFTTLVTQTVGTERAVGLAAALPYGVVVRNRTSQAIAAIDTIWTAADRTLLNAADSMFGRPILYVKPGQTALLVPPGVLQNSRQLQIFANGTTAGHRMENFVNPGNVTVTVDAVVFESGEFVGENRYGAFEAWDAQLRAPRELASSLLQKRETQSVGEIVSWVEGLASVRRPPKDPLAQEMTLAARGLLAVYRSKGEAEFYARAGSMATAQGLTLHR